MENTFDLTPIIEIIIALVSALITGFLIPYLRKKLSAEKLEETKKWINIAVNAAEQIYGGKTGKQKKEYVVKFLLSKGIVVDVDEVTALIESEVYKLTQETAKVSE